MQPCRILVVEDFELFRRFICSALRQREELQIVGEASDGLEAVQKAEELQPDLILLDIGLPKLNGLEAARQAGRLAPVAKVLFLSQEVDRDVMREAFRLGGRGYVHKSRAQNDLLPAVEAVFRGESFVSSGLELSESIHASVDLRRRLDELGAGLVRVDKLPDALDRILDASIEITGADFGNIQILDRRTSELKLMAHRGFGSEFVRFFETVRCDDNCVCGAALKNQQRVIVEDVSTDPIFCGTEARTIMLNADARACQSTPLSTQSGELLGMLSTHYRRRYRPSDSTLQQLDLVARQAADLIQRLSH